LDNAGEWKWLKPICTKHGITMQFTAPNTPQQNAIVEREFPTIRNMAYACLQASDMSDADQMLHWAHAVDDCTVARNLQPRKKWANAYEPFGEKPPVKPKDLVPWGAKGWMTNRTKIKGKFTPKAVRVTRMGYAKDHSSDTYIVLKEDTKQYVMSRDIKWDEPR
jgi:transposase InsO family protein